MRGCEQQNTRVGRKVRSDEDCDRSNIINTPPLRLASLVAAEMSIKYGCTLPGYYRLVYFLHEQGNRIVGKSTIIKAVRDFGDMKDSMEVRKRTRLFRVYFSNRWDMEMERRVWRSQIVPRLRKFCDDRFIDFAYVECAIDEKDAAWQSRGEAMSKMLKGIRYCSPVFVGCYGEMLGLPVNRKAINRALKEQLTDEFPFLGSEVFDPAQQALMSTTEVELMEALFIPAMEAELFPDGGAESDKYAFAESVYAFIRHPSLMSINFPEVRAREERKSGEGGARSGRREEESDEALRIPRPRIEATSNEATDTSLLLVANTALTS